MTKAAKINPIDKQAQKLKTAAYCRVSSNSEEQLLSFKAQILHYESYIKSNPEWIFAGLYLDEGVTGTKISKRSGFLRLLEDCKLKKIDLIITKSVSRFARNVTDCLDSVRMLNALGIEIYFEEENIRTGYTESELILSILSAVAEQESHSLSENLKWGIQKRFKNGKYKLISPPYGFDSIGGELVINEKQADTVKFIFEGVLSGKSTNSLAEILNTNAIKPQRSSKWNHTSILSILSNEKYIGDALYQKTYTDYSFKRHVNNGEKPMYYTENRHEGIISKADFEMANKIIEQSAKEKGKNKGNRHNIGIFSSKIKCICGGTLRRRQYGSKNKKYPVWVCMNHKKNSVLCSANYVKEEDIEKAFVRMINKLILHYDIILKPLLIDIKKINNSDTLEKIEELDTKATKLLERRQVIVSLMRDNHISAALFHEENNAIKTELAQIKETKADLIAEENTSAHLVSELLSFVSKSDTIENFDEKIFSEFISLIKIDSKNEIIFNMKCGLNLRERSENN